MYISRLLGGRQHPRQDESSGGVLVRMCCLRTLSISLRRALSVLTKHLQTDMPCSRASSSRGSAKVQEQILPIKRDITQMQPWKVPLKHELLRDESLEVSGFSRAPFTS